LSFVGSAMKKEKDFDSGLLRKPSRREGPELVQRKILRQLKKRDY